MCNVSVAAPFGAVCAAARALYEAKEKLETAQDNAEMERPLRDVVVMVGARVLSKQRLKAARVAKAAR